MVEDNELCVLIRCKEAPHLHLFQYHRGRSWLPTLGIGLHQRLIGCNWWRALQILRKDNNELIQNIDAPTDVLSLARSPDGHYLLVGMLSGSLMSLDDDLLTISSRK